MYGYKNALQYIPYFVFQEKHGVLHVLFLKFLQVTQV